MLAEVMKHKVVGEDEVAAAMYGELMKECGKYELQFERYYDHGLLFKYTYGKMRSKSITGVENLEEM